MEEDKFTIKLSRAELVELIYRLGYPPSEAATIQEIELAERLMERLITIRDHWRGQNHGTS